MNKIISIVAPYLIIIFVGLMSFVAIEYQVMFEALIVGITVGTWLYALTKCEGTNIVMIFMFINTVVLFFFPIFSILTGNNDLIEKIAHVCVLLIPMQCIGYYLVMKNKPRLFMSYQYSFKNKRKRYF